MLYLGTKRFPTILTEGSVLLTDTSDATATAADVVKNVVFYGPNGKGTGTLKLMSLIVGTVDPTDDIGEDGDLYWKTEVE